MKTVSNQQCISHSIVVISVLITRLFVFTGRVDRIGVFAVHTCTKWPFNRPPTPPTSNSRKTQQALSSPGKHTLENKQTNSEQTGQ